VITVDQALLLARALLEAAREEARGPEVLRRLQHRMITLLPPPDTLPPPPEEG
jgi:hypothetical protein